MYSLCAMEKSETPYLKRRLSSTFQDAPHYKIHFSDEKEYSNVEDIQVKSSQRQCAYYSTKQKPLGSQFMCTTCNVGLCFFKGGALCFEKYHQ